ncbi:fasciclin domain-containing protein [Pantanalinema sp. GBBB05]|uniref:fasciclin domain-containing protein n=1 Tax=Pantanalinema sp. GBBB05 TaxID=2604139 RepID=UPI001D7740AA|nr:fasciclin domain-containing protein [Pantanalinema sp. GBBB05]
MANLLETVAKNQRFTTLISAVETAELTEILQSPGPFTILAPSDEAFARLPEGTIAELLQDIPKLQRVLLYHVLPGDVRSDDLAQIDEAPTVEGSVIAVEQQDQKITVNQAKVIEQDVLTDNGVIHTIDRVLMPALLAGE